MLPQHTAGLRSDMAMVESGSAATFEYEVAKLAESSAVSRQAPRACATHAAALSLFSSGTDRILPKGRR